MYPWPFDYIRAESVEHAVATLAEHGPDAAVLAGGCSLIPLMKYRLATPEVVVDIGGLADELRFVSDGEGEIRIGALVRHGEAVTHPTAARQPLVPRIAQAVADVQIRNMGTVVGGVCSVAPISDWITALIALRGTVVARSSSGDREIDADAFVVGMYENSLADEELATEVRFPTADDRSGASHQKLVLRANDAMVNTAAALSVDAQGRISSAGLALGSVTAAPYRAAAAEDMLLGEHPVPELLAELTAAALEGVTALSDAHGDAEYRKGAAGALLQRAVLDAYEDATTEVQP
jgi:aerobic carbon-monoxide dehydrogenase medium subunit